MTIAFTGTRQLHTQGMLIVAEVLDEVLDRQGDSTFILIAFPEAPEQHPSQKRSGTWMTVRMALKDGKAVEIYPLWRGNGFSRTV